MQPFSATPYEMSSATTTRTAIRILFPSFRVLVRANLDWSTKWRRHSSLSQSAFVQMILTDGFVCKPLVPLFSILSNFWLAYPPPDGLVRNFLKNFAHGDKEQRKTGALCLLYGLFIRGFAALYTLKGRRRKESIAAFWRNYLRDNRITLYQGAVMTAKVSP